MVLDSLYRRLPIPGVIYTCLDEVLFLFDKMGKYRTGITNQILRLENLISKTLGETLKILIKFKNLLEVCVGHYVFLFFEEPNPLFLRIFQIFLIDRFKLCNSLSQRLLSISGNNVQLPEVLAEFLKIPILVADSSFIHYLL